MNPASRFNRNEIGLADADCRQLHFEPFTYSDADRAARLCAMAGTRACDFTIGGIYMWTDYFRYTRCFLSDTMFIRGVNEDDTSLTAFSLPVGLMPLDRAVELLRGYCRRKEMPLRFSAVPEDRLDELTRLGARSVSELTDWADYIYDAESLASLRGKRYNKKRNHVNRFTADNPGWKLTPVAPADIPALLAFVDSLDEPQSPMAQYERDMTRRLVGSMRHFPMLTGAMLSTPGHGIVAFTLGEIIGDTLHLHIEKMRHDVAGAGEAINALFARHITALHPSIDFINRQDDSGDAGLRAAKESYHPVNRLRKYNVVF